MSRVWCELKLKNIFIVSKITSFQNPPIPDSQMCTIGASVKSSRALKNTGLRQAYQSLGSKLVTDHILALIRCIPTTWTFQVFSMNSDARYIKGVGACVIMERPDGLGKRAIVLPKMQWVFLDNNERWERYSVLTILTEGMINERRNCQIFPGQAQRCTEDMALDSCPYQRLGRTYFQPSSAYPSS